MYTMQHVTREEKPEKECIHSGHFMVSTFEAEEQDDEDNVAVPIPENTSDTVTVSVPLPLVSVKPKNAHISKELQRNHQQLSIDTSLSKLFQAMSLAYRQKLTSPKWNRFRGIRLRWKDKIRLNNVIWRCWHLQFIKKENTLICQFASPLDVDTHNKPEAVVLEGKYWKRKLAAVTAEYKRWRMFYRNNILGHNRDAADQLLEIDLLGWDSGSSENIDNIMMVDEDYMGLMSDTLFSTITNQPFVFPDSREIAKAGLADFIQPSLGPLQPNLEDYMDLDPFQALIGSKLATVPEEIPSSQQPTGWGYMDNGLNSPEASMEVPSLDPPIQVSQYQVQSEIVEAQKPQMAPPSYNNMSQQQYVVPAPVPTYPSVISKNNVKTSKSMPSRSNMVYSKSMDNIYPTYSQQNRSDQVVDRIIMTDTSQIQQVPTQQPQHSPQHQHQLQQEYVEYKLVTMPHEDPKQGYKFSVVTTPSIKFTSPQVHPQMMQSYSSLSQYSSLPHANEDKPRRRGGTRGRGRSRSNTREPIKRPPLVSAASDPSLLTPQNSVLLTQLLTNSTNHASTIYNRSVSHGSLERIPSQVRIKEEKNSGPVLSQASSTTIILPAQVSMTTVQSPTTDPVSPILLNSYSNSNSPIMDPLSQNIHSPTSSQGSVGSPGGEGSSHRDRRAVHIHAEQKRRYNIKNGFDMIHSLIPHLNQNPNAKLSKAAMLQKGAEYIRQLRDERSKLKAEMDSLRQQIETLNSAISNCQSMLPATGAPVSRRRDSRMQEMFEEYVRMRTMDTWKFWIFGLIFKPLLNSFNNFVSSSSLDDLYRSTMLWTEQHCTLGDLRPVVLNSLKYLCTTTDVLTKPEKLPEETQQLAQSKRLNK
ncbi:unnamed protein product [Psylliodes chrysocephalus]|uniref:BHLH domain-containing protein n=1 Tax=Psylliodes chrysocephalus TaxID=3402493 RepID=A0A9P0D1G2_9CUCU|nr:unnamed protein product [Psylliodes chrysocephala]